MQYPNCLFFKIRYFITFFGEKRPKFLKKHPYNAVFRDLPGIPRAGDAQEPVAFIDFLYIYAKNEYLSILCAKRNKLMEGVRPGISSISPIPRI
jgi:hypothetical protein